MEEGGSGIPPVPQVRAAGGLGWVFVGLLAAVLGPLPAPWLVVQCRRWAPGRHSRVVKRNRCTVAFLASSRCDGLERGATGSGCASDWVWRCVIPNLGAAEG